MSASAKLRGNPLREHTNQMLPTGVGRYDFLPWTGNERLCKISKKIIKELNPLKGPLEGKFQEISRIVETISLPDKTEVQIKNIGKGHATTAYIGDDNWVYLVTSDKSGDKSKAILSEFSGSPQVMKHIPYCEEIGFIRKRNGNEFHVFRMPLYRTIKSTDKKAYKQLKLLSELYVLSQRKNWHTQKPSEIAFHEELENNTTIDPTIREAMKELCEHLSNYEGNWKFEFPNKNVSVDDEGNIVFLDVFFDERALNRFRARSIPRGVSIGW